MNFEKIFPNVTDDFGHWFAGFTDGEGSFSIHHDLPSNSWALNFQIHLRALAL